MAFVNLTLSRSMLPSIFSVILCFTFVSFTVAQTSTSCNPTKNTTCSSDTGLSSSSYSHDFTKGSDNSSWTVTADVGLSYTSDGAAFTISEQGDSPTIETSWYFFFGVAEVHMRAANGTGIVSSVVIESDDLDEIDWEFIGGNSTHVESDYFGKGNTTAYDREVDFYVDDVQSTSHNYTVEWTKEYITWYVDGTAKRTLNYADAVGGKNFPQTPSRLKLGIWAGGDSEENGSGTVEWAGGEVDYDDGPFTMYVESVKITNYNPAASYSYGDETGDWSSIKLSNSSSNSTSSSGSGSSGTSTSSAAEATSAASDVSFGAASVVLSIFSALFVFLLI